MHRLAAPVLFLALISCSSLQAPDGPRDAVILFGSLHIDCLLLDQPVERVCIVQVDPAFPREVISPTVTGGMFFTEPLPLQRRWRIASVTVEQEELEIRFPDSNGWTPLEFSPSAAGLFFLGNLELAGDLPGAVEVRKRQIPSEREQLQGLLDAWRGTAWEHEIREKIRSSIHESKS